MMIGKSCRLELGGTFSETDFMAFNRRNFLQKAGAASVAAFASSIFQPAWSKNLQLAIDEASTLSPDALVTDEDFWYAIQQSFTVSPSLINLNNGGVSPAPKTVQDAMKRFYDYSNEAPSYYMWRILDQGREPQGQPAGCGQRRRRHAAEATQRRPPVVVRVQVTRGR